MKTNTNDFDRYSLIRSNKKWLLDKMYDENSIIVPIYNLKVLYKTAAKPEAVYVTHKELASYVDLSEALVFLGLSNGTPCFSINIKSNTLALYLEKTTNALFQELRPALPLISTRDSDLLTLARFMNYWHSGNKFCGTCGSKTKSRKAGHTRNCRNADCNRSFFPNMDPAVIVLVSSGDRCLLGRQKAWPAGMYSTLAGFVEPGETIEEAVAREIHEESGIHIENIKYKHSQPWLYPNSLMLGFSATAVNNEILIDKNELEDARWFSKNEIRLNPKMLPPQISIAHKLISEWLYQE